MTTTRDLIQEHNALARELGKPELTGWKASKEALRQRIEAMKDGDPADAAAPQEPSAAEPDEQAPNAAEEPGEADIEPEVVHITAEVEHAPKGKGPSVGW